MWQGSADTQYEYDGEIDAWIYRFDVDGDNSYDILLVSDICEYTLLQGHSLDTEAGYYDLTLSRNVSYTLPVRSLRIITKSMPAPPKMLGDLNGDNAVDVLDAVLIEKYIVEKTQFSDEQKQLADVNHDGAIDVLDAVLIKKFAVEKIAEFPQA